MKRATGDVWDVNYMEARRRRDGTVVALSPPVQHWIKGFEADDGVLPLQFQLEIPK